MIRNYFKIAFRNLRKNKAYLGLNTLGLVLGVTSAIIIFALVRYHLSFDNFHNDKEQVYRIVTEKHRDVIAYDIGVPNPLGTQFRKDYNYAEKVARICDFENQVISVQNHSEIKKFKEEKGVAFVEKEYFEILNFPLLQGNIHSVLSEPNSVILTDRLAKKYFGNQSAIGKMIKVDNRLDLKVTGVLKDIPINTDRRNEIFVSFATVKSFEDWYANEEDWGGMSSNMGCFVKLRANTSTALVESELFKYSEKFRKGNKNTHHYKLQALNDIHFNPNYSGVIGKQTLWVLSFIGFFLVIIACFNFVNLATAQALNRTKEVGIRKVLGSRKPQLFWQFMTETAVITITSVLLAICSAIVLMPYVNKFFKAQISLDLFSNGPLLFFIVILSIVITFVSGAYPGLILAGFQPIKALKGKLSHQSVGGFNIRRSLIISQFAIAQILIISMIVMARQMYFTRQIDLGFNKEAIVMVPAVSFDKNAMTLKQQLLQIPSVESVSFCTDAPASVRSNSGTNMRFESRTEQENFRFINRAADADYVKTFKMELVAGRNLLPSDTVKEYLVNEMLAKKMNMTPQELIGKLITVYGKKAPIVGVVKDFHDQTLHSDIRPVFIAPFGNDLEQYAIRLKTNNTREALKAIESAWSKMHPERIFEFKFLDEEIASFYDQEETLFSLVKVFTSIAIFISCLGLFGLISFVALQKTKEIGIRKVLGSTINQIVWLLGKEFLKLVGIAFIIATPIAWLAMTHWLQDFAYHIHMQWWMFASTGLLALLIAFITVSFQAIRAAIANPIKSLRTE
jgi:putative ABC transport system permease protein